MIWEKVRLCMGGGAFIPKTPQIKQWCRRCLESKDVKDTGLNNKCLDVYYIILLCITRSVTVFLLQLFSLRITAFSDIIVQG